MQILLPQDAGLLAESQAAAAGYASVDEYIANLIRRQPTQQLLRSRESAFQELSKLRGELPRLSTEDIVRSVHEARTDLL